MADTLSPLNGFSLNQAAASRQLAVQAATAGTPRPINTKIESLKKAEAEIAQNNQESIQSNVSDLITISPAAIRAITQVSIDSDSGKTIVRTVDPQTNETIRQLPPEEQLKLAKAISSYLKSQNIPPALDVRG